MEKKKILIVEDEAIIALQIKSELEKMKHSVVGVYASGEEAIEGIGALRPDLVLMDIKLQGELDGIETADRIRKEHDIPVIFLTAYSAEKTIGSAKLTEPYGYVLKPLNTQDLKIAIEVGIYKYMRDKEKARYTEELEKAIKEIKVLRGLLPICSSCKNIRDNKGYWHRIEVYISKHSEAEFTHGLCQECIERLYPNYKPKKIIV